jgi:hypothetical protein
MEFNQYMKKIFSTLFSNLVVFGAIASAPPTFNPFPQSSNPNQTTISGGNSMGVQLPNPLGTNSIQDVLCRISGWLFTVSIPLSAIMIIIGAFQIMFAGGNEEKIRTGKHTIIGTVVGFAIILSTVGIVKVIRQLLGTPGGSVCGH